MAYPYGYDQYGAPIYDDAGPSGYNVVEATYRYPTTYSYPTPTTAVYDTAGYDTTGATPYHASTGPTVDYPARASRQSGDPMRYPRSAEDRVLERGRDPDPHFWQGDTARYTWNYIQSGAPLKEEYDDVESTGLGDRERSHNIYLENRRERSRDRQGHKRHKSGDKHHHHHHHHHNDEKHHHKHDKHGSHEKKDKHHKKGKEDKHDGHEKRHGHHRRDSEGGHRRKHH
ncbi:hypothetical protein F5Y08DRAFT_341094 [Xylaria arbuscula]|nr:hypothetical protein F5Y08DRAFT_341094 [Xylaria arbuscula]